MIKDNTRNHILKNALVVQKLDGKLSSSKKDLLIENGIITKIEANILPIEGYTSHDYTGCHILPGLIDTQVHFREPGLTHKEDIASGTKAAVKGGVTGVFEMPNTKPSTDSVDRIQEKLDIAKQTAYCDYAFYAGATHKNTEALNDIIKLKGCCGIKVFMGSSTGSLLVDNPEVLENLFKNTTGIMAFHCEDESRLKKRRLELGDKLNKVLQHPEWRDVDTALIATKKIIELAKKYNRKAHILHVTTAEEWQLIKANKDFVTAECTPQHMYFKAPDIYERIGTLGQMNPPIREERHQLAIQEALKSKVVDLIGSDHAPHTLEEKSKDYPGTPSGMPGVQTIIPVMLDFINKGLITIEDLVYFMCEKPIEMFKLTNRKLIEVGAPATLTIVDLNKEVKVDKDWLEYKCGWSPFTNETLKGWPVATILRGHFAMKDGVISEDRSPLPIN